MPEDPARKPTLFGRQKTKKLSARQQSLVDEQLPKLKIDPGTHDPASLTWPDEAEGAKAGCCQPRPLWMEIGFGGGEHLAAMAARHGDVRFIGCEPFLNGISKLLVAIDEQNLANIRLYDHDARHILTWLPPASLDRVYILYPDPWPKKRHHKRRFIGAESLALLARAMKPGAKLILASDIGDYIRTSLLAIDASDDFTWTPATKADWKTPPAGWPGTRYEQKAIREGRTPSYLTITRA